MTYRYAPGDQVRNVYFDGSAPGGKFRARIAGAAAAWNKLPGVAHFEVHKSPSMALSTFWLRRGERRPDRRHPLWLGSG